ncbi:MAG: T9SS type B sorting domain-containing protein, partial [Bacteroidia bacterium]|nr:T9SS type B sorting domain-containing protein [Bacteroidia bacterium]
SLSYELISCRGENGQFISGYTFPTANNSFTLDAITGDLIWDTPQAVGEYNVAMLIREYRDGSEIGSVVRDMQITIKPSNNNPPTIDPLLDICVEAGTFISIDVEARDLDNDQITLTGTGGPLILSVSPATFNQPVTGTGVVNSTFEWQTDCDHVRKSSYQMLFKAEDSDPDVNLVDLERLNITVVAPAPKNPKAEPLGNNINLHWNPSICQGANGYKIYRRLGFYGFTPGQCETGVPAYTGYSLIGKTFALNDTTFSDDNNGSGFIAGQDYCYMIVACFPDGAQSYASVEVCTEIKRDLPVITNASVNFTDAVNGSVYVAWSKPTELDSTITPGPFRYEVFRSADLSGTNFTMIASLPSLNDTIITDTLINTLDNPHSYRIDLWNETPGNTFLVGNSTIAASVYLNIVSGDKKLNLNWDVNVPWTNSRYDIYRFNNISMTFDSIGTSTNKNFVDTGLVNGQQYCYKIKSVGQYSGDGLIKPIINWSQENCAMPIDNEPPCAQDLNVIPDCDLERNFLSWNNNGTNCPNDIHHYNIYYTPLLNGDFNLIATINDSKDTSIVFDNLESIAGCYYVTAVDSIGNESMQSNIECVDNCPLYELPNVFTPDDNGKNDLFHPFPYRFVRDIDIKIYNRWGNLVFETTDPDVNWNGKLNNSGGACPDGVYFYTCVVNEIYLEGIRSRVLKGN